jgi:hypothetical protein
LNLKIKSFGTKKINGVLVNNNANVVRVQDHALNHLDTGIRDAVLMLREHGVETVESCQGGEDHAYPEPTVRFAGGKAEGYRALSIALQLGLRVSELRRVWPVLDYEPTGPYWELTFIC